MAVIALMGSGEIAPSMVKVHRLILDRLGADPTAVFLDTPFGFQENADVLTARVTDYFNTSLGIGLATPRFRGIDRSTPFEHESMLDSVRRADYIFAGPGSPSYALRHWHAANIRPALAEAVSNGAAVVLASAAAVTAGTRAIPVYEIYKVGESPRWLDGLDVLGLIGISAVVVPHFNNTEGGNHDTRFCYLGRSRFDMLRSELTVPVIGIDEHTAVVFDSGTSEASVHGKGSVSLVAGDSTHVLAPGETFSFDDLPGASAATAPPPTADRHLLPFDEALLAGDARAAASAAIAAEHRSSVNAMIVRLAEAAERGLVDRRTIVGPYIDLLVQLRDRARAEGDWAFADVVRDGLLSLGVEIRDTPEGTEWLLED